VATQEYVALSERLGEALKRLAPLRKFRQEFEQKAAAKTAFHAIVYKLSGAELEVEK
ncbi:unnamed protein product, partial [Polarella glacialis]